MKNAWQLLRLFWAVSSFNILTKNPCHGISINTINTSKALISKGLIPRSLLHLVIPDLISLPRATIRGDPVKYVSGFRLSRLCRNSLKYHQASHAGESRHPEGIENTGFRVALRLHGILPAYVFGGFIRLAGTKIEL